MKKKSNRILAILVFLINIVTLNENVSKNLVLASPVCKTSYNEYTGMINTAAHYDGLFCYNYTKDNNYTVIGYTGAEENITIPNEVLGKKVTEIDEEAFLNNDIIMKVKLPDTITTINESAFTNCTYLTEINLSDNVSIIAKKAFFQCTSLLKFDLPSNITLIDEYSFYGCKSLKSIVIPNGVKIIKANAFSDCNNLCGIEIPDTVTSIDTSAFKNCSEEFTIYCSINSYAYKFATEQGFKTNIIDKMPTDLMVKVPVSMGAYTDVSYYKTLEEAVNGCNNCTVTLNKNVEKIVIEEEKNLIIDANGYTINKIENYGKLYLYDSSNEKGIIKTSRSLLKNSKNSSGIIDDCSIINYGEMKVEEFKIIASHNVNNYSSWFGISSKITGISNKGILEINNCDIDISSKIENLPSVSKIVSAELYGLDNTGTTTISGTSITISPDVNLSSSADYSEKMVGIMNSESGTIKSYNSKIMTTRPIGYSNCFDSKDGHAGVCNKASGTMIMDGCSIDIKSTGCKNKLYTDNVGIYNSSSSSLTINGGEIIVQSFGENQQSSENVGIYCNSVGKVYIGKDEKNCTISTTTDYGHAFGVYCDVNNSNVDIGNAKIVSSKAKDTGWAYGLSVAAKDGVINLGRDDKIINTIPVIHGDDGAIRFYDSNTLNMYDGMLTTYSENKNAIIGTYTVNIPENYELKQSEEKNGLCYWYLDNFGSISYELNNGNLIGDNVVTSYMYGLETVLPIAEKKGYKFDGWYGSSAFDGDKIVSISSDSIGDISLYAKWIPNTIELVTNEIVLNYTEVDVNNLIDLESNIFNLESVLGVKEYVLSELPSGIIYSESNHSLVCSLQKEGTYVINVEILAGNGSSAKYKIIINKTVKIQPTSSPQPIITATPNITTTTTPVVTQKKTSVATSFSSLSAKKNTLTLKWKKKNVTGYEIQYSTNAKFKGAKKIVIKTCNTTKKKINNLAKSKKYYLRIRTYTKVKKNGKTTTLYSSWSKTKSKRTKK